MSNKRGKETEEKGKKKIGIIICVAVIIALLAIIVVLLLDRKEEEPKRNVVVTPENAEEVAEELAEEEYTEPGYYTVNMNTDWHFASGDAISSDARVDNVSGNTNPVYFDVFIRDQEEEPIYSSPVIPVGSFLENIALDEPLDAGTYDCVIVYHLVDDEQETISTLRVAFQITIES